MAILAIPKDKMPVINIKEYKSNLMMKDILEAINRRIECWEFINFPYSINTGVGDITWRAQKGLAKYFKQITGCEINQKRIPITINKIKDENKLIHIYGQFDYDVWDKMIESTKK